MVLFILNGFGVAGWEDSETRGNGDVCHGTRYHVLHHVGPPRPQDDCLLTVRTDVTEDSLLICEHRYSWSSLIHSADAPLQKLHECRWLYLVLLKNARAANSLNTHNQINWSHISVFFSFKFCGKRGESSVLGNKCPHDV